MPVDTYQCSHQVLHYFSDNLKWGELNVIFLVNGTIYFIGLKLVFGQTFWEMFPYII